jgi:hypothetical protein
LGSGQGSDTTNHPNTEKEKQPGNFELKLLLVLGMNL